jgi:hypothetical protein
LGQSPADPSKQIFRQERAAARPKEMTYIEEKMVYKEAEPAHHWLDSADNH